MLKHVSISQLKLHKAYPRRWCLEYLEGIKTPPTPALEFGSILHERIEDNILKKPNYTPNEHSAAIAADEWYEDCFLKDDDWTEFQWRIEDEFCVFLAPYMPPIKGIIDMWTLDKLENVIVRDHKTANPRYALKAKDLESDWQLNLYGYVVGRMCPFDGFGAFCPTMSVGHNQFFKQSSEDGIKISGNKLITAEIHNSQNDDIIREIYNEIGSLLITKENYEKQGMKAVRETPENKFYFGSYCPYYSCTHGDESVNSCRDRIKLKWEDI